MKEPKIFSRQNLTEKVHYVYRVTIDGKYYIGKRTGFLNDLVTGRYKTSSKLIWEKLQNGMTFSKIKILQVFSTAKDALEFEKRILMRVNAKANPKFLNQCNGKGSEFCLKQHSEKSKEKMSETTKERYDINTEEGRKQREIHSKIQRNSWDKNTEEGRIRRKNHSKTMKDHFNIETEEGRQRRENHSKIIKEKAKEHLQNRKNSSILGDLMFDEDFLRENFLILDDKNNPRFLWSVYSKLSGYSRSNIVKEKRIGKLSFLYGIKSIKLSEELENSKIEEIKAVIKSRNN